MNSLDIVLLLLFVPGIIHGLRKGFLEQAVTLVGIFLSVWVAYHFSNLACPFLARFIHVSDTLLQVIAMVLVLVAALIGVILLAKLFTKLAEMIALGWLNRVFGLVFALGTTALVLGTFIVLFDTLNVQFGLVHSPVLDDSVLYVPLRDFAYTVFPYLKQILTP